MFDSDFQRELLALLVQDSIFLGKYHEVINSEHFEVIDFKNLYSMVKNFLVEYLEPPNKAALLTLSKAQNLHHLKPEIEEIFKERSAGHKQFIKDNVIDFVRTEAVKNAVLTCSQLVADGDLDQIESIMRSALAHGQPDDLGEGLFRGIDYRSSGRFEDLGEPIPTLFCQMDRKLGGGLFPKTLTTFIAPSNVGKSAMLMNLGTSAVAQGKVVFYYTLEMSAARVLDRFDSRFSGVGTHHLMDDDETIAKVVGSVKRWEHCGGEVIVKEYANDTATIPLFRAHMERARMELGLKPDLVIIDYGDLMKHTYYQEMRHQVGSTFAAMRKMAVDLALPVVSATQTNREAYGKETPNLTNTSEDMSKVHISDNVIFLCQTKDEYAAGVMRAYGAKNRDGPKEWVISLRSELERMYIGERHYGGY